MPGLGERIKELREARRLTQHDLASNLRKRGFGTTQTTVSRWEAGQVPRGAVLAALADELGVTVDDLLASEDDEEADPMADLMNAIQRLVRAEVQAVKA